MLRIFTGKPGGGKSYGAIKDVLDEAVNGRRVIVTNLSIDVGRFSAFVQKHHPEADFDPCKRLRILTPDETKKFWRYRRPGVELPGRLGHQQGDCTIEPQYYGCLYVIDEAHVHFDARAWAETGLELTFYNSQHRKFDDEVVFITQFLDLLDKRVRGFCQEYVYFTNHGLQRYLTYFRQPAYFTVKTYLKPLTGAPGADFPQAASRYTLDVELASCYDTSAGVGIPGRGKPEVNRVKGVNLFWIVIPVLIACAILYKTPDLVSKGLTTAIERSTPQTVLPKASDAPKAKETGSTGRLLVGGRGGVAGGDERHPPAVAAKAPEPPQAPVYVKSYALKKGRALVTLSDGREFTNLTGVVAVTPDFVVLKDGSVYPVRRSQVGADAAPKGAARP